MSRHSYRGAGYLRLVRRQLATDWPAVLAVVVLVLLTAGVFSAVPRALDAVTTTALRETVAETGPRVRDVIGVATIPITGDDGGVDAVVALARDIGASLPETVAAHTGTPVASVGTSTNLVEVVEAGVAGFALERRFAVNAMPGWPDQVALVAGELPATVTIEEPQDPPETAEEARGRLAAGEVLGQRIVVDVALSVRGAEVMELEVGDEVPVAAQGTAPGDIFFGPGGTFETAPTTALRVTAIVEPTAPAFFYLDPGFTDPTRFESPNGDILITGTVLTSKEVWRKWAGGSQTRMQVRFPLDGSGLRGSEAAALATGLRSVTTHVYTVEGTGGAVLRPTSDLPPVLDEHLARAAAATAVISLVVANLLAVGLGVLWLVAQVVRERRRRPLALITSRGASRGQLALLLVAEGLLLGLPAAAAGWLAARLLVDGRGGVTSVVLAATLGLAPAVLLPLLVRDTAWRAGRRDLGTRARHRLRLAAELLVVGLAVTALVVLRRRGLATGAGEVGVDPLLAAAPVLAGLAAGLLALRLYPWPVVLLARISAHRRGALGFLASARAAREGAAGAAPLLVLMLALATSVFGLVVASTVEAGTQRAAWQRVGADLRVTSSGFPLEETAAMADVPGVVAWTPIVETDGRLGRARELVNVVAADSRALAQVQQEVPGAQPLGAATLDAMSSSADDGRLPVVVPPSVGMVGEELQLVIDTRGLTAVVVNTLPSLPGQPIDRPWLLAELDTTRELLRGPVAATGVLARLEPGSAPDRDAITAALPSATSMRTPDEVAELSADNALAESTRAAFPIAAALGALYCGLAVVLTLVVSARARHELLSQLRTLGLSPGQARRLAAMEIAPLVVAALVAGLLAGLAIPWVVAPSVELRPLTGGRVAPPLVADPASILVLALAFGVVVAVTVLVSVGLSRRVRLGTVLRVGAET